jgi:hypothetical protein
VPPHDDRDELLGPVTLATPAEPSGTHADSMGLDFADFVWRETGLGHVAVNPQPVPPS